LDQCYDIVTVLAKLADNGKYFNQNAQKMKQASSF
jgi:hypothetical protein